MPAATHLMCQCASRVKLLLLWLVYTDYVRVKVWSSCCCSWCTQNTSKFGQVVAVVGVHRIRQSKVWSSCCCSWCTQNTSKFGQVVAVVGVHRMCQSKFGQSVIQ